MMIGNLPFWIPHQTTETPWDFASRLAAANYRDDVGPFCNGFGIRHIGLVDGEENAIRRLAELARVDPSPLLASRFQRDPSGGTYVYRGQSLTRPQLIRERVRVCPLCLQEDVDGAEGREETRAHRRGDWVVGSIRSCGAHGVALQTVEHARRPGRPHETSQVLREAVLELSTLLAACREHRPTALERYVANRFAGVQTEPWVDSLPLHVVIDLSPIVGAVATDGPRTRVRTATIADREIHEDVGARILTEGRESFGSMLENLLDSEYVGGRHAWGPTLIFGRLYDRLAREIDDPAYDPVKDVIVDVMRSRLPLGPEDVVFGQPFGERRLHSVHSAAAEYGMPPHRMRRILRGAGLIGADTTALSDDRLTFDAREAVPVLSGLKDALTLRQFADYLGIPRPHDRAIVARGLVNCLSRFQDNKGHLRWLIERSEADRFMERMRERADPGLSADGMVALPDAAKVVGRSTGHILELLLSGRLSRVALHPTLGTGYLSVLVDTEELASVMAPRPEHLLTLREAARRIQTSDFVVRKLIERGHLSAEVVFNLRNHAKQEMVPTIAVKAFQGRFVFLQALAMERGLHFSRLLRELRASGVPTADDPRELRVTMYRRTDVQ